MNARKIKNLATKSEFLLESRRKLKMHTLRFFVDIPKNNRGMTKEEIEKLEQIKKTIRSQTSYKILGLSLTNEFLLKKAALFSAVFLIVYFLLSCEIFTDENKKRRLKFINERVY